MAFSFPVRLRRRRRDQRAIAGLFALKKNISRETRDFPAFLLAISQARLASPSAPRIAKRASHRQAGSMPAQRM